MMRFSMVMKAESEISGTNKKQELEVVLWRMKRKG